MKTCAFYHRNKFNSLTLPIFLIYFFKLFFLHLLEYQNKSRECWLPRITDKLIMIDSQFIHMFTTSLGRHTQRQTHDDTKRIRDKNIN